jgi:hypothetical protein
MNKSNHFISQKLVKVFRLFKYVILGTVFVTFAFLRGISGWNSDRSLDAKKLSKDDLNKLFSQIPKINADVGGGGIDGNESSDGSGSGGGC